MNVLIIGSGGREHALAWKAAQSKQVEKVFVAPGNAGTALEDNIENLNIDILHFAALTQFAKDNNCAVTIVGPEVPLVEGVVDYFAEQGLNAWGPRKGAAQLEGSKAFTKDFLARHNIPSAFYGVFTEIDKAVAYIEEKGAPIVIKADGLAAGKGVILAQTNDEAIAAVNDMLAGNKFGDAGARVVIEEFLVGEEVSFIVMVDGDNVLPMASSQDHKAALNGDLGPNTGGMGAYSPAAVFTKELEERAMREVIMPTVQGMKAEGNTFTGFLYAGLMIAVDGTPNVLEYNVRFGDPETQPIMARLNSDLIELVQAGFAGKLDQVSADWDAKACMGVVMAAGGYPDEYKKGDVISGLPTAEIQDKKVFHAGTKSDGGNTVTAGGRVLCVTAKGDTVTAAQASAYDLVKQITWNGVYYRTDIGHREIAREQAKK